MKIRELFAQGRPIKSCEVFPPKREGSMEALFAAIEELKAAKPDYVSVTYGAGGSTRDMTFEIAVQLKKMGVEPLVHMTCVGQGAVEIGGLLDKLAGEGIENILALRGDPPKGQASFTPVEGGFKNAGELVRFIRSRWNFSIGVAGYPETHPDAKSAQADMDALKYKVDAGADFINTQLFFDNALYWDYAKRAKAAGVAVPVVPGIMPALTAQGLARFAGFGTRVPQELKDAVERADGGNDLDKAEPGLAWAGKQCRDLLTKGAPGIHLYMMNKAWVALDIYKRMV